MIKSEEGNYPIRWMCEIMGVSESGYHKWKTSQEKADDSLLEKSKKFIQRLIFKFKSD